MFMLVDRLVLREMRRRAYGGGAKAKIPLSKRPRKARRSLRGVIASLNCYTGIVVDDGDDSVYRWRGRMCMRERRERKSGVGKEEG